MIHSQDKNWAAATCLQCAIVHPALHDLHYGALTHVDIQASQFLAPGLTLHCAHGLLLICNNSKSRNICDYVLCSSPQHP